MREVVEASFMRWAIARVKAFVQAPHHLFLVGFIGIAESFYLGLGLVGVVAMVTLLLGLTGLIDQKVYWGLLVLGGLLGFFRVNLVMSDIERSALAVGDSVDVSGFIAQMPKYEASNAKIVLKLNDGSLVYTKVSNFPIKRLGDYCFGTGNISEPTNLSNDFDFKQYLRNKGVYLTGQFYEFNCNSEGSGEGFVLKTSVKLSQFRETAIDAIERAIPEPNSSLLAGILFGVDRVFKEDFAELLRLTGTTHIIAASGYNVMVVSNLSYLIFGYLRFDYRLRRVLSILAVWMFAIMAGLSPSVVRAAIMLSFILLGQALGFIFSKEYLILLAIAISIAIYPGLIWQLGYQLSLFATLGLVYIADRFELFENGGKGFVAEYIKPTIVATFSVSFIMLWNFGSISLIGLIANVLVLPLLEMTMSIGALGVFISLIGLTDIGYFFIQSAGVQLDWFIWLIHIFESWNFFVLEFSGYAKLAGYVLFAVWILVLLRSMYLKDREDGFVNVKYYL